MAARLDDAVFIVVYLKYKGRPGIEACQSGIQSIADHDGDNIPGEITYHHGRPDPKLPGSLKTIEVYDNWISLMKHVDEGFAPNADEAMNKDHFEGLVAYVFGDNFPKHVIDTLTPLDCIFLPAPKQGYIIHPRAVFHKPGDESKPILLNLVVDIKDAEATVKAFQDLVDMATEDVVTLVMTTHQGKNEEDFTDITGSFNSNEALGTFLGKDLVKSALKAIAKSCNIKQCALYGEAVDTIYGLLNDLNINAVHGETVAGYIISPNAAIKRND